MRFQIIRYDRGTVVPVADKNDPAVGRWYIGCDEEGFLYLHSDGVVRNSTSVNGKFLGWYRTRQAARDAVKLAKSKGVK